MEPKTDLLEKAAILQRDRRSYAIAPHIPGGIILNTNILRKIADVADKYEAKALKLTSAQRIAIVGLIDYHDMQLPSKLKIGVSGCMNYCSKNAVKDLGIVGTPKGFNILIGGNASIRPRLADLLYEHVQQEEVLPLFDKIINYCKDNARKYERMSMILERLTFEKVKQDIISR